MVGLTEITAREARRWSRERWKSRVGAVMLATVMAGVMTGTPVTAEAAGETGSPVGASSHEERCKALADLQLEEVTRISAELITSGEFKDPQGEGQDQKDLPEFCRVVLTVEPQVNIEVWLPTDTYNGRFQAVGNGYFAGFIAYDSMGPALQAGYATASTDTGHPETGTR